MTKFKLVPIEPTREMWAAAGDAVVALGSRHHDAISEAVYKAMLAAAPVVQGEAGPVGWVWHSYNQTNFTSGSHHKEVLEADGVKLTPVYTAPQPTPDVSALVEVLEACRNELRGMIENHNQLNHNDGSWLYDYQTVADAVEALVAYHEQGGA